MRSSSYSTLSGLSAIARKPVRSSWTGLAGDQSKTSYDLVSVIVCTRHGFHLVEQLSVVIEDLKVADDGSGLARLDGRLLPLRDVEVGAAANQQHNCQSHGSNRANVHRRAVFEAGAQAGIPTGRRCLALL